MIAKCRASYSLLSPLSRLSLSNFDAPGKSNFLMFNSQRKRLVRGAAVLGGIAASLLISRMGAAQENSGFPFVIPWDDGAPTLIDLAYLNAVPAGRNGRIVARGE